ncbi:hypothetical protein L198_01944 [Cryptococcus wingfieldii CBS 7118]|uniref:Uncharacterized protein n=1 Tax=Cryptococcus wingfieldii CBS 7118 TaxID=1295528 RepID=A0A1E3JWT3_9TREE|nr:hypothetical protein L198_01944 [Cryptococcus wingfieldii CBS 7118]ODO05253.1 hypothetical protein L198_01944 [Cryptococcus wingfieldii CBS 7118]
MTASHPLPQPCVSFTWYIRSVPNNNVFILTTDFPLSDPRDRPKHMDSEEARQFGMLVQTFIPEEHELFVQSGPFAGQYERFEHVCEEIRRNVDRGIKFGGEDTKLWVAFGLPQDVQAVVMGVLAGADKQPALKPSHPPRLRLDLSRMANEVEQPDAYTRTAGGFITPPLIIDEPDSPSDNVPPSRGGNTYSHQEVAQIVRSTTHDLHDHIHALREQLAEREDMLIDMDDLLSRRERDQVYVYVIMTPELGLQPFYRVKKGLVSEDQIRTWVVHQTGLEEFQDAGRYMVLVAADQDMPYQHWFTQQRKGKGVLKNDTDVVECIVEMVPLSIPSTDTALHRFDSDQRNDQQDMDITPTNKTKPLPNVSQDAVPHSSFGSSTLGLQAHDDLHPQVDHHPRVAEEILKILRDERVPALSTATRRLVALAQSLTPATQVSSSATPPRSPNAIKSLSHQLGNGPTQPPQSYSEALIPPSENATTLTGSAGETRAIRGSITSIEAVIGGSANGAKTGSTRTAFDMLVWRRDVGEAVGDEEGEDGLGERSKGGDSSETQEGTQDLLDVPRTRREAKRENPFLGHRHQSSAPPATSHAPSVVVTDATLSPSAPLAALRLDEDIPSPTGSRLIGATHVEDVDQPEKTSVFVPLVLGSSSGRCVQSKSPSPCQPSRTDSTYIGSQALDREVTVAQQVEVAEEGSPRKKAKLLGERLDSVAYVSGAL